jgi:hypothetical protein
MGSCQSFPRLPGRRGAWAVLGGDLPSLVGRRGAWAVLGGDDLLADGQVLGRRGETERATGRRPGDGIVNARPRGAASWIVGSRRRRLQDLRRGARLQGAAELLWVVGMGLGAS